MFNLPAIRKVFEGVASRHEMYALFNRHSQSPFDDDRINGTRYVGEWFEITEADHDHMFEILPPLFYRGDMFAMRNFWQPASLASSSRSGSMNAPAGFTVIATWAIASRSTGCGPRSSRVNPGPCAP